MEEIFEYKNHKAYYLSICATIISLLLCMVNFTFSKLTVSVIFIFISILMYMMKLKFVINNGIIYKYLFNRPSTSVSIDSICGVTYNKDITGEIYLKVEFQESVDGCASGRNGSFTIPSKISNFSRFLEIIESKSTANSK